MSKVEAPFLHTAVAPTELSFVPLDTDERMDLAEILERHPKGKAYAWTLEGMKKYPIILDRNKNVLSFPPIINGNLTRLSESTRNIFIDVTGTEQKAVNQALNILVTSILDRGGKAYTVEILEK
jgi:phenylalanyl-tRNA synthetase beta chain